MGVTASLILLLLSESFCLIHGQPGFISLDCGKPESYRYSDGKTKITYTSDYPYIETGEIHSISSEFEGSTINLLSQDVRSFPNGKRNCYALKPVTDGKKYIVRALFMYGNYDGLNDMPQFDLYIGTNLWSNVRITKASETYSYEIYAAATGNSMSVCLVDTENGRPFISALELRPLDGNASYADRVNWLVSLVPFKRINFGASPDLYVRYPLDRYDRIWEPYTLSSWTRISTTDHVGVNTDDDIPTQVIQTAVTPTSGSSLNYNFPVVNPNDYYYVTEHFAELVSLKANETRILNMSESGQTVISLFSPHYLSLTSYSSVKPVSYDKLEFSVYMATGSVLGPIINAMEIYIVNKFNENATSAVDVEAITEVKAAYKIQKNWMGDPCAPQELAWDGLKCNYDIPYRITSLNLTSSGLTGPINPSLSKLSDLVFLDLSNNNLTGAIPDSFAELTQLKQLNLACSGINGPIPEALKRSTVSVLFSDSCEQRGNIQTESKGKKNVFVIAIPVTVVASILLVIVGIMIRRRFMRKDAIPVVSPQTGKKPSTGGDYQQCNVEVPPPKTVKDPTGRNDYHQWNEPDCRRFSAPELADITNNFRTKIGKGGFGDVYYGVLDGATHVAVKMLSALSAHTLKQFLAEINILKRVHHKNLVPFIGYCEDKGKLALVYEYMPNGSLADHLSGKIGQPGTLSWNRRLQIALDASSGLEYLHAGCRQPVVHRDVKAANILLTADMEARIADFGLSKIFSSHNVHHAPTQLMGTPGYLDPEYTTSGFLTEKSDVYSFGIVLLELITGRPAVSQDEEINIVNFTKGLLNNGDISNIVDRRLRGEYQPQSAWQAIDIAMECVRPSSRDRPAIGEVVAKLKECLEATCQSGASSITTNVNYNDSNSFGIASAGESFISNPLAR